MSLVNFMQQKAVEKGTTVCPNCGVIDMFFSLTGKCTECDYPLPDMRRIPKLQFSLEVLTEFTQLYDEFMPVDYKKVFLQLGRSIIDRLKISNAIDVVSNSKIIHLQHLCNNIVTLGGNDFGGAVDAKKMSILLRDSSKDPIPIGMTLGAVILSLKFVKEFEVVNEYLIEDAPIKPSSSYPKTLSPVAEETKSGCLGSVLALSFIVTVITLLLSQL